MAEPKPGKKKFQYLEDDYWYAQPAERPPYDEEQEGDEGYKEPYQSVPRRMPDTGPVGPDFPPGYFFEGGPGGFESMASGMIDDLSGKVVDEARWLVEGAKKVPGALVDMFRPPVRTTTVLIPKPRDTSIEVPLEVAPRRRVPGANYPEITIKNYRWGKVYSAEIPKEFGGGFVEVPVQLGMKEFENVYRDEFLKRYDPINRQRQKAGGMK